MKTDPWILKTTQVAFLFLIFSGCKTFMHFKYGLTQPKEETTGKLESFLEKNHFPTLNQYMFSDSAAYCKALRHPVFSKNLLSHMIFNKEGKLLQHDTSQCQWSGYDKIKSLNPDSIYEISNGLVLDQILPMIKPFGSISDQDKMKTDPDFTVIVTWAKFIGTYNYRLFVLSGAIMSNYRARIRLIWLNIDMQEQWELTRDQKVAIR